jgi:hypothetical protein
MTRSSMKTKCCICLSLFFVFCFRRIQVQAWPRSYVISQDHLLASLLPRDVARCMLCKSVFVAISECQAAVSAPLRRSILLHAGSEVGTAGQPHVLIISKSCFGAVDDGVGVCLSMQRRSWRGSHIWLLDLE